MQLSNIKIAWKMAITIAVMSLGIIGAALAGGYGLMTLRFHQSNIYDFMLIPIVTINQADVALSDSQFQIEELKNLALSAPDRANRIESIQSSTTEALAVIKRYETEWVTTVSPEFTAILRDFGRLDLQEDEVATLAALQRSFSDYAKVQETYLTSVRAGQPNLDSANSALTLLVETRSQLQHLIEVNDQFADLSNQAAVAAYYQALNSIGLAFGLAVLVGLVASFLIARSITQRLGSLAQTATLFQQGNLEQPVTVTGRDEVGLLAQAFQAMSAQLQELIGSLETRVAGRTQRLEIVARLSEHLTAILNLEDLLAEVVNDVKNNLGYYHAHIYLLDKPGEKLVVAAGAGEAGIQMKARGHNIPLKAITSLVARAARTGQVVHVDNVRESPDWLSNPLLPETHSEMAVPIILEGQTIGVLDVQEDEVAGLDEGDASLLRSLANHVAVTIRNARQFEQVESALAEARTIQKQYLQQAWIEARQASLSGVYQYRRPGAPVLPVDMVHQLEQEAMHQDQPLVVGVRDEDQTSHSALVTPIKVQDQVIGIIQLHEMEQTHLWSEQELALVQTIANQVAQTAENLRLFDETRQWAGQEQSIREITDKLRAAPNVERLLEIATIELSQRLSATHAQLELGMAENGFADTVKL